MNGNSSTAARAAPRRAPPPDLRVEEITTSAALEALEGEWSCLWRRCPEASPFQAPEWLLPWWRHLGRGRLMLLALRREGALVGLAPLVIRRSLVIGIRRALLMGTGPSDYLDFLIAPEAREDGAHALLRHLAERRREAWGFCDFQQLPPTSLLRGAAAPEGFRRRVEVHETCPTLILPETPVDLGTVLPGRIRSNVRYYGRRIEGAGAVGYETAGPDTLPEALESLFRLHQARWNRRRLPGAFITARARAFHREAAERLLGSGLLRLHLLRLDGEIRAALYGFACHGRFHYYLGGFDPALAPYSPGTLLIARALEEAVRERCREFHFLRGDEAYKYHWGATDRENARLLLWPEGRYGSLVPRLAAWEQAAERGMVHWARRWGRRRRG